MEKPMQFEQRPDDVGGGNTEQTENMEGNLSFEWGPELGKMSWHEAQEKITELNKNLKEGEKPWRLPTKEELLEVIKPFRKARNKTVLGLGKGFDEILEKIRRKHDLHPDGYWSSNTHHIDFDLAWVVFMSDGRLADINLESNGIFARSVR